MGKKRPIKSKVKAYFRELEGDIYLPMAVRTGTGNSLVALKKGECNKFSSVICK